MRSQKRRLQLLENKTMAFTVPFSWKEFSFRIRSSPLWKKKLESRWAETACCSWICSVVLPAICKKIKILTDLKSLDAIQEQWRASNQNYSQVGSRGFLVVDSPVHNNLTWESLIQTSVSDLICFLPPMESMLEYLLTSSTGFPSCLPLIPPHKVEAGMGVVGGEIDSWELQSLLSDTWNDMLSLDYL